MLEDILARKVNCVIVKDLSRFGRDYIEVGKWIQKRFLDLGIRFIAILDRYDSKTATESENALLLPMKNFINDFYCRDISQKVRSHQKIKREKGAFIGAFAIYGYCKSEENRNQLKKDPYAAEIVKKIYQWRISGISMFGIAKRLNQAGILSPMEYKQLNGENYYTGFGSRGCAKWTATAIKRILEDETYTGMLVQGKGERISYKVRKSIPKKQEDWIRVLNCHEAIISREEYGIVQRLLKVPIRARKDTKSTFLSGLLFCADCKKPLIRRKNCYKGQESIFYICSTKNKGLGCSRHSIKEEVLFEYIGKAEQIYFQSFGNKNNQEVKKICYKPQAGLSDQMLEEEFEKLKRYKESYQTLCASLERETEKGILTKEEAVSLFTFYKGQEKEIEEIIAKQQKKFQWDICLEEEIRRRRMSFLFKCIEVEEDGYINFILNSGEIYRLSEGEIV